MKKVFMTLAAVAAVFAGCQKPELDVQVENVVKDTFTASMENFEAETKTALNGLSVVWSDGDQLAIFQGSTLADKYELEAGAESVTNGKFVYADGESYPAGNEFPTNVALYPYADDLTVAVDEDDASVYYVEGFVLPTTQTYAVNSFGQAAFPMVAVTENTEDNNLKFKNLLGLVKFQFTGTQAVKSVTLKGKYSEPIAGPVVITAKADNTDPELTMNRWAAETQVTLDCGEGVQLNEDTATDFYIALPPTWFEEGFTVTVETTDGGKAVLNANAENDVYRSKILVMPAVEVVATLPVVIDPEDVNFEAVPSMTDADITVSIDDERVAGFYGMFVRPEFWAQIKEACLAGGFDFNMALAGALSGDGAPCYLYEGTDVSLTLSTLGQDPTLKESPDYGVDPDYTEYVDMYCVNQIQPNSTFVVVIVPYVQGVDSYTIEDAMEFEVKTGSFTYGGNLPMPEISFVEGYQGTQVTVTPSADVKYIMYEYFQVDGENVLPKYDMFSGNYIEYPTNENYIDALTYDSKYDPSKGACVIEVNNDAGVTAGTEYKLCLMLVDAAGKTTLHVVDVKTLPIPFNESLTLSFVDTPEFTKTEGTYGTVYALVNVPTEAVKLYSTMNTLTEYDEYEAEGLYMNVLSAEPGDLLDLTEDGVVVDGTVQLTIPVGIVTRNKTAVAVHVIAVDANNKVSHIVSSTPISTKMQ